LVRQRQSLAIGLAFGARRASDLQHPQFDAAAAVAQLGPRRAGNVGDLLHRAGQHPHPIAQQTAVGGVVDVGLDHGGVDAHAAPGCHPVVARDLHDPLVDLLDHFGPQRQPPSAHGFGVGHLGGADAGEIAVHQIGAHLSFQHPVTPVAHVLEHQQTQHHLGRGARPAACAAPRMPLGQGFVNRRHDLRVGEQLIGVLHPRLVQILDFIGDQPVAEAALCAVGLNHALTLGAAAGRPPAATMRG